MNINSFSKRNKLAYVYALVSADRSLIKIGKARDWHYLSNRIAAHRKQFLFDLSESFCFQFDNDNHATKAEQSLLRGLRHWKMEFETSFPGHTEYLVGSSLTDIFRVTLNCGFVGFLSMEPLLDELAIEDYELPTVTIQAQPEMSIPWSLS